MNDNIYFRNIYYNDLQRAKFYNLYRDCAHAFGCYYMGYIYEDHVNKTRFGFTTHTDWQEAYIGNHLIEECHKNYIKRKNP